MRMETALNSILTLSLVTDDVIIYFVDKQTNMMIDKHDDYMKRFEIDALTISFCFE